MLKRIRFLLLSCLIVAPISLQAKADELMIGYVNMERVIREAPVAVKAGKKVELEFEARRRELQQSVDDIKARQAALAQKGSTLSDSQRRLKEAELSEISVRSKRKQQELQEDINVRQNEEMAGFLQKANSVVAQIAEAEHFGMILNQAVTYSGRVDITDKVIKKLAGD